MIKQVEYLNKDSNHPDYLQQLSHHIWNNTDAVVTEEILSESMDMVIRSNMLYYQDILEIHGNIIPFNDPIFEYWLKNFFFNESN